MIVYGKKGAILGVASVGKAYTVSPLRTTRTALLWYHLGTIPVSYPHNAFPLPVLEALGDLIRGEKDRGSWGIDYRLTMTARRGLCAKMAHLRRSSVFAQAHLSPSVSPP